jgi:transposase
MRSVATMTIVEILRLSEMGLSQREIARSAGCGKSTVGDLLRLCCAEGICHEKAKAMKPDELHALLYPNSASGKNKKPVPDFSAIHSELVKHKNLNLQFMWEEYRKNDPDGLSYSQFCAKYREHKKTRQVVMHQEKIAGEEMEVDWAGDTLACVYGADNNLVSAHFFVAVLGYSAYPYVEAFENERQINWLAGHVNALDYFGGIPRKIIPDNCRTAVSRPQHYEPSTNMAYAELGRYYEVAIVPARIRKPQDKPFVESSVRWVETWLLGALRNQKFFSFGELNKAIRKHMAELTKRPFQKREGSRFSVFQEIDKPALRPLPKYPFELAETAKRKVGDNYHVEFDGFHYSVPYALHKETVTLRATSKAIEIIDKSHARIATHQRRYSGSRYITLMEHMPENHKAVHVERQFDGARYRSWAKNIGENTYRAIDGLLSSQIAEEQAYRACMGILQLSKPYGQARLESACAKAIALGSISYSTIGNILKNGQDTAEPASIAKPTPNHENIRGGGYFS